MLSVIILTHNAAHDIGDCIDSLYGCDDIHVIDGGSSDQTVAIARQRGAHVHVNRFVSFAKQRNWALEHCPLKHEWVLHLDADERSSKAFYHAVATAIRSAEPRVAGFYCCRKLMCGQRWLRHSDAFPRWQFRISRRTQACFIDYGDAQPYAPFHDPNLGYIDAPLLHYPWNKGWHAWIEKRNHYTSLKAHSYAGQPLVWRQLLSAHPHKRATAWQLLHTRWLIGAVGLFIYNYCLRLGFLDGKWGFIYCMGLAYESGLLHLKIQEARKRPTLYPGAAQRAPLAPTQVTVGT
jgi:glycosyltransferase involved in cell wall biosynthesis